MDCVPKEICRLFVYLERILLTRLADRNKYVTSISKALNILEVIKIILPFLLPTQLFFHSFRRGTIDALVKIKVSKYSYVLKNISHISFSFLRAIRLSITPPYFEILHCSLKLLV